jgi:hypothetical protein
VYNRRKEGSRPKSFSLFSEDEISVVDSDYESDQVRRIFFYTEILDIATLDRPLNAKLLPVT